MVHQEVSEKFPKLRISPKSYHSVLPGSNDAGDTSHFLDIAGPGHLLLAPPFLKQAAKG